MFYILVWTFSGLTGLRNLIPMYNYRMIKKYSRKKIILHTILSICKWDVCLSARNGCRGCVWGFSLLPCLNLKIGSIKGELASVLNGSAPPASNLSWEELGIAVSAAENMFMLKDFCERHKENNKIMGIWKEFIDTFHFTNFSFQQTILLLYSRPEWD